MKTYALKDANEMQWLVDVPPCASIARVPTCVALADMLLCAALVDVPHNVGQAAVRAVGYPPCAPLARASMYM